jgi:coproporphyrinogen III oxidase-like Fe-S oxidoreductase
MRWSLRTGRPSPAPDDDDLAHRYEVADAVLSGAGLPWYEISNWGTPCRHNLAYWRSENWWGVGPGAHSHVGGVRWWNVRHPATYAKALQDKQSPALAREILEPQTQVDERVLLESRLAEGLSLAVVPGDRAVVASRVARLIADGLVVGGSLEIGRVRLTRRGRLLADTVVHALLA